MYKIGVLFLIFMLLSSFIYFKFNLEDDIQKTFKNTEKIFKNPFKVNKKVKKINGMSIVNKDYSFRKYGKKNGEIINFFKMTKNNFQNQKANIKLKNDIYKSISSMVYDDEKLVSDLSYTNFREIYFYLFKKIKIQTNINNKIYYRNEYFKAITNISFNRKKIFEHLSNKEIKINSLFKRKYSP